MLSGQHRYGLWGGSIRSNKTWGQLILGYVLAKSFPRSRWALVMNDMPTIKKILLPSFFNSCPPDFIRDFNHSDHKCTFQNGSEFLFMAESFDQDKEGKKFLGLEVNGILNFQCEAIQERTFEIEKSRIGQWPCSPMPPMILSGDCNPTNAWPKKMFYQPWKAGKLPPGYYFQEADILKTPGITPEMMENFKSMPKELYALFILNDWDAAQDVYQLIPYQDIYACSGILEDVDKAFYLGVDVGHKGTDPSLFTLMQGPNVVEQTELRKKSTVETENRTYEYIDYYKIPDQNITIDGVGVGAGVVDHVIEKGHSGIVCMLGGGTNYPQVAPEIISPTFAFANWKAYSYWLLAETFKAHKIGGITNDTLIAEAQAIKYFIKGEKVIQVESKEDLKMRIGHSCDYFDSLVYANWSRFNACMDSSILGTKDLYK
jgi:hypothetical protein